jgi:hypothetical protein
MEFCFTYTLTKFEKEDVTKYLDSLDFFAMEQHPEWCEITGDERRCCYFLAKEENNICCFAQLMEYERTWVKMAHLQFGPATNNPQLIIDSVLKIYEYYKKERKSLLTIQLALPTGANSDYIEYRLNALLNIKYVFDRNNWSSIYLDLSKPTNDIFRSFSKGHKSDVKRAVTHGLSVKKMPLSNDEIKEFGIIFNKMYKSRDLSINENHTYQLINNLSAFFENEKRGNIYIVKEASGQVVGGIIILHQGKSIRYYKGASNPERRDLPILHIAIWEAIKDSKEIGFEIFDFWGYNHMVNKSDQVFHINRFKKGFGGKFSFYPKVMRFVYQPLRVKLYIFLSNLKNTNKIYKMIRKYKASIIQHIIKSCRSHN